MESDIEEEVDPIPSPSGEFDPGNSPQDKSVAEGSINIFSGDHKNLELTIPDTI